MTKKLPELSDVQVMLIVKNALDYNAKIVSYASFIYGQEVKHSVRKRFKSDLIEIAKDYTKSIEEIVEAKS